MLCDADKIKSLHRETPQKLRVEISDLGPQAKPFKRPVFPEHFFVEGRQIFGVIRAFPKIIVGGHSLDGVPKPGDKRGVPEQPVFQRKEMPVNAIDLSCCRKQKRIPGALQKSQTTPL